MKIAKCCATHTSVLSFLSGGDMGANEEHDDCDSWSSSCCMVGCCCCWCCCCCVGLSSSVSSVDCLRLVAIAFRCWWCKRCCCKYCDIGSKSAWSCAFRTLCCISGIMFGVGEVETDRLIAWWWYVSNSCTSHGIAALSILVVASPAPELLFVSASSIPSAISDSHPDPVYRGQNQIPMRCMKWRTKREKKKTTRELF